MFLIIIARGALNVSLPGRRAARGEQDLAAPRHRTDAGRLAVYLTVIVLTLVSAFPLYYTS